MTPPLPTPQEETERGTERPPQPIQNPFVEICEQGDVLPPPGLQRGQEDDTQLGEAEERRREEYRRSKLFFYYESFPIKKYSLSKKQIKWL